MLIKKQVDKDHYAFYKYMSKERWTSIWHQLDEVMAIEPNSVLEIGPGPGTFKNLALSFGVNVKTLDLDPALEPDYVGSASAIPLEDSSVDVACAFQVLEHMPFEISKLAFREMCRISRKAVIISLPQARRCWPNTIALPYTRRFRFLLQNPFFKKKSHAFDGEHYWEIDKLGYELAMINKTLISIAPPMTKARTYRVHENPYHRFFIFNFSDGDVT